MALYAIGDIQGCAAAFDALLAKLRFRCSRDQLWLVGDLVNRGPDSLGVLRRVMALGRSATCVLGNHDLHLLAVAAGHRAHSQGDTFADVFAAADADAIVNWLRHRPLLHYDAKARRVLVHAGIPPAWSVAQARSAAREIEQLLRGPRWRQALRTMYGNEPARWHAKLPRNERRRFTINALTRMRYCDEFGGLELTESSAPGSQRTGLTPWFEMAGRRAADTHIVFGHWAALGLLRRAAVTALDTGCVWGRRLTAVRLDRPARAIQTSCAAATSGGPKARRGRTATA